MALESWTGMALESWTGMALESWTGMALESWTGMALESAAAINVDTAAYSSNVIQKTVRRSIRYHGRTKHSEYIGPARLFLNLDRSSLNGT